MADYDIDIAVNANGEAAVRAIDKTERSIKSTGDEAQRASRKTQTAGKAIEDAFTKAGESSERLGKTLSASVTAPLAAIAGTAAVIGTNFDSSLAKMNTLVGVSRQEIAGFREEILGLAPALGNQPQEMADALFSITSAGQRGALAMETLEAATKASAIGLGQTREIALASVAAVTAYGQANLSSAEAVEILVGTVEQGNLEASELAGVLGRVIGLAAEVGVSFEEAGAFIAAFTRQGVDAAQAVTGLRGVLSTLVRDPTAKAIAAFEQMDMTAEGFKQQIADRGFIAAFQDLVNNAEETGVSLGSIIPEVEGLTGALAVFASEGESAASIADKVGDAVGTLEARLEAAMELDPSIAFKQMKAELTTLQIEISANVLPALLELAEMVRDISEGFRDLDPAVQQTIVKAAAFAAATGPVLLGFGLMTRGIRNLIPLIIGKNGLVTGFQLLTNVIGRNAKLSTLFAAGLGGITGALGALSLGVGVFIGYKLQERFKEIAAEADTLADSIRELNLTGGMTFTPEEALERQDHFADLLAENRQQYENLQNEMSSGDLNPRQFNEASQQLEQLNEEYLYVTEQAEINSNRLVAATERMFNALEPAEQKTEALKQFGDAFAYVSDIAGLFSEDAATGVTDFFDSLANPQAEKEPKTAFNEDFQNSLEDLRAQLDGPVAQAQLKYNRLVEEANTLFQEGEIALGQRNESLALYKEQLDQIISTQFEENLEEIGRQLNVNINASNGYGAAMTQLARGFIQAATGIDMLSGEVEDFDVDKLTDAEFEDQFENLREGIDGAYAAQKQLNEEMGVLREAFERGLIDETQLENLEGALQRQLGFARTLGDELVHAGNMGARGFSELKSLADEGSDAYYAMEAAIQVSNIAAAIGAILNQGMGDPYTAFARMAMMAAMVGQLVGSIGNIIGGASDPTQQRQDTQGTGTVLGDEEAKSESIANATDITAKAVEELVGINRGMLRALQNLQEGITGASGMLARGAGQMEVDLSGMGESFVGSALQDIFDPLGGPLADWLGGDAKVVDEGLQIMSGTIEELMTGTLIRAFKEVSEKKHIFDDWDNSVITEELDEGLQAQFGLVFESINNTVLEAAKALGLNQDEIENAISGFTIDEMMISLEGLSAEEQQAELEAVFGQIFDGLVREVIPFVEEFQKIGEGLGETLVRVATSVQVTEEAVRRLNISMGDLDAQQMAEVSVGLVEAAGGIEQFISDMENFVSKFASEDFQFNLAESDITRALEQLNLQLPETRQGFFDLINTIDETTDAGQRQIATLLGLADAADTYYSGLEEIENERLGLQKELLKLNGEEQALREMELQKLDESNRKMQLRIWALQDEIDLQNELAGINNEILQIMSPVYAEYNELATSMANQINLLEELGASESQLAQARWLHRLQVEEYVASLRASIEELTETLFGSEDNMNSSFNSMSSSVSSTMDDVTDSIIQGLERIEDWLNDSLFSENSPLRPGERLSEAENLFNQTIQDALSGDAEAVNELPNIADQYLDEAANYYGTSTSAYNAIYDNVRNMMENVADMDVGSTPSDPTYQQMGNVERSTEETSRSALETARLSGKLVDQIAILYRLTGDNPSDIAEEFDIPLADLVKNLTGDLPQLTGDALKQYFDDLVFSIDDEMSVLLNMENIEASMLDSLYRIEGLLGGDWVPPEQEKLEETLTSPIPDPVKERPPQLSSGGSSASYNAETNDLLRSIERTLKRSEEIAERLEGVSRDGFNNVTQESKKTRREITRNPKVRQ